MQAGVWQYREPSRILPRSRIHVATKHKTCTVAGCNRLSHGKAFCGTHLKKGKQVMTVPVGLQGFLRSDCCAVQCTLGKRHDYGEQYCEKCGNPCCWKTQM